MAPRNEKLQQMILHAQNQINKMKDNMNNGVLTEEEQTEALQTINDMLQKIERLAEKTTVV